MSSDEPIDRGFLLRELRELLPVPVREATHLDGSLVMIGGDPGEIVVRVSGDKLTVSSVSVRWEGPHTCRASQALRNLELEASAGLYPVDDAARTCQGGLLGPQGQVSPV
jgi:hypothetical protein